jgi:uncharacterized protein
MERFMELPSFRYHPDPLGSGSIVQSAERCRCCGKTRGYIYAGPVYSEEELDDALCPWCIADGAAHGKFDATFVDSETFGEDVPAGAMDEIAGRTPGFDSWQNGQWPGCCGDAAAFVAPAGIHELRAQQDMEGSVMTYIVQEMGISGGAAVRLLDSLRTDKGPTVYIFQCLHCGRHLFRIDQL